MRMATPAGISPVQQNIPVAQPIPVAYPVAVVRADQRAREDAELLREGAVRHDLKAGDTVPSLAMKYGVSVSSMIDLFSVHSFSQCMM